MEKGIYKLERIVISVCAFLLPLVFLPIFPNVIITAKVLVLTLSVSLLVALMATKMLVSKKLVLKFSKFDLPLFLVALAYLLSGILKTPNKMEAFFLPGTASVVIASFLFYFLTNQLDEKDKNSVQSIISLSGIGVSLVSLLAIFNIFQAFPVPEFMKGQYFTTLGGNLPTAMFLGVSLLLSVGSFTKINNGIVKYSFVGVLGIITLGLIANIYVILPGKEASPRFAPTNIYWSVAVDALKESPLLGIGPGNYLSAFNRFRSVSYNATDLWQIRFANANSFAITSLTEAGLLSITGLIMVVLLLYGALSKEFGTIRKEGIRIQDNPELFAAIATVVMMAIFPSTPTLIFILFLVFSFIGKPTTITLHLSAQKPNEEVQNAIAERVPAILVAIPIVAALFFYYYYSIAIIRAEYTFQKSLEAFSKNDGQATYNLMRQATAMNPFVDRYHTALSEVCFALASSISQKPDGSQLTDEERQTISVLIQQSIDEGKAAVTLNQTRSGNWELLANTYRNIMAYADGADQFAVEAYSQAIALDPISPTLRVTLGGVYYAIGDYDSAIDTFKLAVLTKPDFANARYNLAIAYREKKDFEKAIAEMQNVLSLLDPSSKDYELAKTELEKLESNKSTAEEISQDGEELNAPEKAEPAIEPQIELPEEAAPPQPEVTPPPSPEETANPTPTAEPGN